MTPSLAVFLHSHQYDRVYQAVSLMLAAATMGWTCHLFLFHQALASYMDEAWDDTDTIGSGSLDERSVWSQRLRTGFESSSTPSLYEMLDQARASEGGLTLYACSASVKVLGLDVGAVRARVDEIVGLPTMLKITGGTTHTLYI